MQSSAFGDNNATHVVDLSLWVAHIQGDIVAVVRRLDDNWFEGQHGGRQGLFPVTYVELIRSSLTPSSPHSSVSLTASTGTAPSIATLSVQEKWLLYLVEKCLP